MISYKLAKQLKETGFKQPRGKHFEGKYLYGKPIAMFENGAYAPTLLELLNACGDDFGQFGAATVGFNVWRIGTRYPVAYGKTAEEAIADLWLKLNEKRKEESTTRTTE